MNATRDPIDVAFGTIIRARRTAQRMSLEELGRQVGVTYQQIQKYETGANRVSVSTAKRMAKAFGCSFADLAALIDDAEPAPESPAPSASNIGLVDRKLGRLDNLPDHIRAPLSALVDALTDRNGPVAARQVVPFAHAH